MTDDDGASASDTLNVVVKEALDTTPPVITTGSDITIIEGESLSDAKLLLGVTATDDKDGNVQVTIKSKGGLDTTKAGKYTITYEAKDKAGNKATSTKKVIVSEKQNEFSVKNQIQDALAAHNSARKDVGVNNGLVWSETIAKDAESYAEKLANSGEWKHDPKNHYHGYVNGDYGENLYASTRKPTLRDAVEAWVGEKANYHYNTNACDTGKVCGHYTQVVWKDTTEVGCAIRRYKTGPYKNWYVVVCKYKKPGNWIGEKPY